jgi:hypothetical protein
LEAKATPKPTTAEAKAFEPSASYKVDKINFIVERVFREEAENINAILAQLIVREAAASA